MTLDWPTAVAISSAFLSTGGVVLAALLRNCNGDAQVSKQACEAKHEAIGETLNRLEDGMCGLHKRMDDLYKAMMHNG